MSQHEIKPVRTKTMGICLRRSNHSLCPKFHTLIRSDPHGESYIAAINKSTVAGKTRERSQSNAIKFKSDSCSRLWSFFIKSETTPQVRDPKAASVCQGQLSGALLRRTSCIHHGSHPVVNKGICSHTRSSRRLWWLKL